MATTYPGGLYKPLGPQTQGRMRAHEVICLHTMVGYLRSTHDFFADAGYGGTESHFGVGGKWGADSPAGLDGAVWQWQDLDFTADANYEGNGRVVSIETADNAPSRPEDIEAWTPAQCDAIVGLVVWLCRRYSIPPVIVADTRPGTRGIGWHALGTAVNLPPGAERWSTTRGKPCPTSRRIAQIKNVIVPRVQADLRGEPEEDELSAAEVKQINDHIDDVYHLLAAGSADPAKPADPAHLRQSIAGLDLRVREAASATDGRIGSLTAELSQVQAELAALKTAVGQSGPAVGGDLTVTGTLHVES